MFLYKCLPIFTLLINSIACDDVPFKCGEDIGPNCVCYTPENAATSQLVCTDTNEKKLVHGDLLKIGEKITGDGNLLHIHNADTLTEISKATFKGATFKKIFIEHNIQLASIDKEAFKASKRTEILAVRSNNKLKKSGLFGIALALSDSLSDIEFQENSIEDFENAFNDAKFTNLAYIRLDGQLVDTITLKMNSFGKLPKIKQLSLNNKKLSFVKVDTQGVIDLTGVTPSGRVSIFLQNSQLETADGLLANLNKNNVGLDLEDNKLKSIPEVCVDIVNEHGTCFLGGNKQTLIDNCKCKDVQNIKKILLDTNLKSNIWGLTDVTCEGKAITSDECTTTF